MASETRVARVLSRGAEAAIPIDVVLGDGYESAHHDALMALAEDASNAPRTNAIERVVHVVVDLSNVLRYQTQAFDLQYATLSDPMTTAILKSAGDAVARSIPTTGGQGPQTLLNQQAAARGSLMRQQQIEAADRVVDKFQDKASKVAATLQEDVALAMNAIETEIVDFDQLDSIGADLEITDLQKIQNGYEELRAMGKRGLPTLHSQVESNLRLGRDMKVLAPIARKFCNMVIEHPEKYLVERVNHDEGQRWARGPGERDDVGTANAILQMLADAKEAKRPESIAIALSLLQRAYQVFAALAGRPANDVARMMYVDTPINRSSMPFDLIDPDWLRRFLKPSGLELPGWSAVMVPAKAQVLTDGTTMHTPPVRAPFRGMR